MAGHACWSLVLTRGHCMNLGLRCIAWHRLLTRLHQRWPAMQAWTMYEYGPRSGVHLHAVIYGVPGISPQWVQHIVGLLGDGTKAYLGEVGGNRQIHVRYLTKQLADPKYFEGWPRYFRPVSVTRGWCPDWRPDWRRRRRRRA